MSDVRDDSDVRQPSMDTPASSVFVHLCGNPVRLELSGDPTALDLAPCPSPQQSWELLEWRRDALNEVQGILHPWLNDRLGCVHDHSYWDLAIGQFLRLLVARVQWTRLLLEKLRELGPHVTLVATNREPWEVPATSRDVWLRTRSHASTHQQLLSRLIPPVDPQIQAPPPRTRQPRATSPATANENTGPSNKADRASLSARRGRELLWWLQQHPGRRALFFHSGWEPRWWLRVGLLALPRAIPSLGYRVPLDSSQLDLTLRDELALLADESKGLTADVLTCLPDLAPVSILEGHTGVCAAVEALLYAGTPAAIIGPPQDDLHLHWAAEARVRGAQVIFRQHGGFYGESLPTTREEHEREASDGFISWGWQEPGTFPLPAGNLTKRREQFARKKPRTASPGLLWVTQEADLVGASPPYEPPLAYRRRQEQLLSSLDDKLLARTIIRLRPPKVSEDPLLGYEWLRDHPVQIDAGREMIMQLVRDAGIVVIDRPFSTTFLECLAVDKPAVVFAPGVVEFSRPTIRPIVERLVDAGVIHNDATSAAVHLARVFDCPRDWWDSPSTRDAVAQARSTLACTSQRPAWEWARFIRRIVRRSKRGAEHANSSVMKSRMSRSS